MPDSITIDVKQFTNFQSDMNTLKGKIGGIVDDVLNKGAEDIATLAKQKAPVDMGGMRAEISANNSLFLEKHITVNAFYAPFIHFGTGKYAAEEVARLPADWQQYAATFKGQRGGGSFDEFLRNMIEWVKRKGIAGRFSVKTQRRQKINAGELQATKQIAYLIVRKILKDGIRPHPFLFEAFEINRPIVVKNVETALKAL